MSHNPILKNDYTTALMTISAILMLAAIILATIGNNNKDMITISIGTLIVSVLFAVMTAVTIHLQQKTGETL